MADDSNIVVKPIFDESYFSEESLRKYPRLVKMIVKSETMDFDEKTYWASALDLMSKSQLKELWYILKDEQIRLAAIDEGRDPNKEQERIKQEKMKERKKKEVKKQEIMTAQQEKESADALLEELNNLS